MTLRPQCEGCPYADNRYLFHLGPPAAALEHAQAVLRFEKGRTHDDALALLTLSVRDLGSRPIRTEAEADDVKHAVCCAANRNAA
jgi:hypothetical protein